MLGLGFWEVVILAVLALVVVGPEQLPDFAKSIAKFLNEMKRTTADLKSAFDDEKDIFKDNIDQLQKLKNDIASLPHYEDEQKIAQYEIQQARENSESDHHEHSEDDLNQLDLFAAEEPVYDSSVMDQKEESPKVKD